MINHIFRSNWLKILNYNTNVEIVDKPSMTKEMVRIPLTPLNINVHILYYLFEDLYPIFINDQQNILDIIISDDFNEILGAYLYKTKKAGIHESFEILSNDLVKIQKDDLENIEIFFNKIQNEMVKKTGIRISSIRVFKKKAIDLINAHCTKTEGESFNNALISLMNLIQIFFDENLFYIYPIPNFYKFIKKSLILLNGLRVSNIYKFLYNITPKFNISILLNSQKQPLLLKVAKKISGIDNSDIFIELITPNDLGIKIKDQNIYDILNTFKKKMKSDKIYLLNQRDLISLLLDIFESESPPPFDKLKIIFQKVLLGIRNFENKWYRLPRPKVYNSLLRFFTRIFRFNLNLKKLSHWAIPDFTFNIVETNFGLNSKILVIFTAIDKRNFNKVEYVKNAFKSAFLIEYENRRIINIKPINKKEIFTENQINSLDVIRANISNKYGYVSAVMNIDTFLLTEIFENFASKLFNFNPFSNFKCLNLFKKEHYFNIFPEIAEFQFLKDVGSNTFIKSILPILIDKHEF